MCIYTTEEIVSEEFPEFHTEIEEAEAGSHDSDHDRPSEHLAHFHSLHRLVHHFVDNGRTHHEIPVPMVAR